MELVKKTFLVLETLAALERPSSLSELTERVKLPKPTVYRILRALVESGYAQAGEGSGVYVVTGRLRQVARGNRDGALLSGGLPLLERLHRRFNETVNLGARERHHVRYVQVLETTRPLRWILKPGETDCLYTTALGKAMLAAMPEEERHAALALALREKMLTPAQARALPRELRAVARNGWSIDREHTVAGVICLAISLRDQGHPEAAVSIAIPTVRFGPALQREVVEEFQTILRGMPQSQVA